jgi:hypothetical protein
MIRNHNKPCWTYSSRRPVGDYRASFCDLYSALAVRRVRTATGSPLSAVLTRTFTSGGLLLAAWNFRTRFRRSALGSIVASYSGNTSTVDTVSSSQISYVTLSVNATEVRHRRGRTGPGSIVASTATNSSRPPDPPRSCMKGGVSGRDQSARRGPAAARMTVTGRHRGSVEKAAASRNDQRIHRPLLLDPAVRTASVRHRRPGRSRRPCRCLRRTAAWTDVQPADRTPATSVDNTMVRVELGSRNILAR